MIPGEPPSEGLITEKGEPRVLVGLFEAELVGCCDDMAAELPNQQENDEPSAGHRLHKSSAHC